MKAGLFECDHIDVEYQDKFGDYSAMFAQLFPELEWTFYDVCNGEFPKDLNECEVYFTTGSRKSVYDKEDWIDQLKATIRKISESDKYFVGCCFGHQLLGEAMGGKVSKSPNGWCVGVHEFEIKKAAKWMQPFQNNINLLMMCQDQVLELPEGAKVLAGNQTCPAGVFQVGGKMLGIQAHPEYSKAYNQLLMEMRIDRMGKTVVNDGIARLEKEVHQNIIRSWILNFIQFNA